MLTREILWRGSEECAERGLELRAGSLAATLLHGELRHIRWHGVELLQRIYCAVRDANWETVAGTIRGLRLEQDTGGFQIHFVSRHVRNELDFEWHGAIEASVDGVMRFAMDGVALKTFQRNRIGFCVLHGAPACAGRECAVRHSDGHEEAARFPKLIAPQQPFLDVRALRHEAAPGVAVEVEFEGEEFETEDQRNWTDNSFKTYCTPLRIPYPATIEAGTRVTQRITVRVQGETRLATPAVGGVIAVDIDTSQRAPLPAIGVECASHGELPEARELARLKAIGLQHLRVNADLRQAAWPNRVSDAIRLAQALALPLEVAVQGISADRREARALVRKLDGMNVRVCRWLLHDPPSELALAVFPRVVVFEGTDSNFAELNRQRPTGDGFDGVCFSLNPQVHASDDETLVENLEGQGEAVRSARAFSPGAVVVSPVTLKPRFNAVAAMTNHQVAADELPPQVDVRQMSLFGAAWTLGSLQACALSGAASLTYFETTGWRGVMEREAGSPLPRLFPSIAGAVFPLYHVLADAAEYFGGTVVAAHCSNAPAVGAFALEHGQRRRIIIANYTAEAQLVSVAWSTPLAAIKRMDESNAERAMTEPEAFRAAAAEPACPANGRLALALAAHGLVRIDGLQETGQR